jgi:asparagine synthase (glutamine-hydrolysing)
MCGIWLYLHKTGKKSLSNSEIYESFMKISNRGPDKSSLLNLSEYGLYIGFHRLSIIDTSSRGDQPFSLEDDERLIYSICNGEIYNFEKLCENHNLVTKSGSDCEVIPQLYEKYGMDKMIKLLEGEFSFCICDINKKTKEVNILTGRDQTGIRPMFITGNENEIVVTSELKGSPFLHKNHNVKQFPPRHYSEVLNSDNDIYESIVSNETQYNDVLETKISIFDLNAAQNQIEDALIESVKNRLHSDRPLGCLLSGGLDSSLIAAIASKHCKSKGTVLNTFSVGFKGSTDSYYAKKVADHIGSNHCNIVFEEDEWINSVENVIETIESYDVTTVRASTGQFKICEWISKNTDIKVLLIGDGSDELCSGYMYFHNAPNSQEMNEENLRLVRDIHYFDVLRADRGVASNGLEARVPFLDNKFIETYLKIDPTLRMPTNGIEKWLLRDTFKNYLPKEVLMRHKEAFSDGISSQERSWYTVLQEHINEKYSDEDLKEGQNKYTHCTPINKEALHFRKIFESKFGNDSRTHELIPYFWLPKWVGDVSEPSARVLNVYKK